MFGWRALLVAGLAVSAAFPQPTVPEILSRIAEEASVFQQNMPKALTQETLEQRTLLPPTHFHARIGTGPPPKSRLLVREIVSEYSVGTLQSSDSGNLLEFRQVISVDGRPVQTPQHARHALSLGIQSADDRVRKRMLEDFAKHGLVDVATDYGLILLAFTRRGLENVRITPAGSAQVGADSALLFRWKQTSTAGGELEFHGRQSAHRSLEGRLWVRRSDGLPLRIEAWAEHLDRNQHKIRDEATVEYSMSAHGFLTPASVVHRHRIDGQILTENQYRYEPFKLFSADADIKFTEIPDTAPPVKK